MQRVEAQHRTTICWEKNLSLKALRTFCAPSLLSLMCGGVSWLGCRSIQTHEPESVKSVQQSGIPGETGCGLTCSILPSSSSQQLASLPNIPIHRLECQPVSPTGSWVWQCWLQGSDGLLIGPSAQQPHEGRQRGWERQVCLCSTCCPPPHHHHHPLHPQRPGQMLVTVILETAERTETKANKMCDGMKFDLRNPLNKNQYRLPVGCRL